MRHLQPSKVPKFYFPSEVLLNGLRRCLGIENKKGTLRPGADADFTVFDKDGFVLSTWIKGKAVWNRS